MHLHFLFPLISSARTGDAAQGRGEAVLAQYPLAEGALGSLTGMCHAAVDL